MNEISDALLALAGSPWAYVALFVLCIVDAFFPPLPSESLVVGFAAIGAATGVINLWWIAVVAAAGAAIGDHIAYVIGRAIGLERFAWMRRPRVVRMFTWARHGLDHRGGVILLVARYIPGGRTAVNMVAGATHFPLARFTTIDLIACVSWAVISVVLGALTGRFLGGSPVLAFIVAIVIASVLGFVIDGLTRLVRGLHRRVRDRRDRPEGGPRR